MPTPAELRARAAEPDAQEAEALVLPRPRRRRDPSLPQGTARRLANLGIPYPTTHSRSRWVEAWIHTYQAREREDPVGDLARRCVAEGRPWRAGELTDACWAANQARRP